MSSVHCKWFAMLVTGIGLACSAQGQLHTQDEDELKRIGWSLVRDKDGVVVYNRKLAESQVHGIMAQTEIDVEAARIFAVITDFDNWADFMPNVQESEIIDRSERVEWVYLRFRAPFIKDRSFVSEVTVEEKINGVERYFMKWQLADERTQKLNIKNIIVPKSNTGYWDLRPIGDGAKTSVTYCLHADPGGNVPNWMINFANAQIAPKVFRAVRQQAQLDQYGNNNTADTG
ncbi:MAG: SRPBCC family protein [Gammaproteobacteria bacterium]|nr:SRPBCC family protein [Gammaproteobacteria bacterium]